MAGAFVVSLDFELMWGVRDHKDKESYGAAILGARKAIPRMLEMFDRNGIRATWATVGMLLCESKDEMLAYAPRQRPTYENPGLSNYSYLDEVGDSEGRDPYYFGYGLVKQINGCPGQEIGTHTFSHYYCLEPGQQSEQFEADLKATIALSRAKGIDTKSIVFPRNQYSHIHLDICQRNGIRTYRGSESSWIYRPGAGTDQHLVRRAARLADSYINLSGHHSGAVSPGSSAMVCNVPSSRFLRPWSSTLRYAERVRVQRILRSMRVAARMNGAFHLWWHPHNFGLHPEENFAVLKTVLDEHSRLSDEYDFKSVNMYDFSEEASCAGQLSCYGKS
jgi:peptidoglycan/xylan/chitin deacetylase (PgdA/CDA1 family)